MAASPDRQDLPIPNYDGISTGDLGHRIRSLEPAQLDVLVAYEREHAHRLPVLHVLQARLDELADGSTPSGGDPSGPTTTGAPAAGGSQVSPQTQGPPVNPAPQTDKSGPTAPLPRGNTR